MGALHRQALIPLLGQSKLEVWHFVASEPVMGAVQNDALLQDLLPKASVCLRLSSLPRQVRVQALLTLLPVAER